MHIGSNYASACFGWFVRFSVVVNYADSNFHQKNILSPQPTKRKLYHCSLTDARGCLGHAPLLGPIFSCSCRFREKFTKAIRRRPRLGNHGFATENTFEVYSHHYGFWRGSSELSWSRRICSRPCTVLSPRPHLPSDDGNPCAVWSGAGTS